MVGAGFIALLAAYLVYAYFAERDTAGSTAAGEKEAALIGVDPAVTPASNGHSLHELGVISCFWVSRCSSAAGATS